jgi:hypothetical protein
MPANLAPVDTWPANFQVEADGDAVSQAIGTNIMQEYSDAATYLYNRSIEASGGDYQIPIAPVDYGAVARWDWSIIRNGWHCANVGGADEIVIPLPALIDCTFTSVSMILHGDGNAVGPHAGAVGTMPRITLYRLDATAGTWTNVGNQVDTTVAPATYEVLHTVTFTPGAAQTVNSTTQYAVSIRGESGANSLAFALVMFGLYVTVVPS